MFTDPIILNFLIFFITIMGLLNHCNCGIIWDNKIFNIFFIDGVTLVMFILTTLIFPLVFIYIYKYAKFAMGYQLFLVSVIETLVFLSFSVDNILYFYLLFESVLIPMFVLIGLWGSRGRKLHAAYQFFFFTFFSSIFIFSGILTIYFISGSLQFTDLYFIFIPIEFQYIIAIFFFIGFMSKIPTIPLHIWLPEAHVEAPTIGSVILASILLKFGFYGMVRTIPIVCNSLVMSKLFPFFATFCVMSIIYGSLSAVRQIDLKKIIAYSSIVHMNFSLLGLFVNFNIGLMASTFLMLSHGLISGAMFFSIGFLYERFHVRNIIYYGGLVQLMPIFSSLFFLIIFSNMSLPGTCNFVGEFFILLSLLSNSKVIFFVSSVSTVLVVLFSLMVLVKVFFYQFSGLLDKNMSDLYIEEFIILVILLTYIFVFGLFPNIILNLLFFA